MRLVFVSLVVPLVGITTVACSGEITPVPGAGFNSAQGQSSTLATDMMGGTTTASTSSTNGATGSDSTAPTAGSTTTTNSSTAGNTTTAGTTATTSAGSGTASATGTAGSSTTSAGTATTGTSMGGSTGMAADDTTSGTSMTSDGSGTTNMSGEPCTDEVPDDRETCATWAEWGECENPNGWLDDFCDLSCGRCSAGMSTGGDTGGDDMGGDTGGDAGGNTGDTMDNGGMTDLGNDNPYPPIQNGSPGFSTRYWDCCKPHCAWTGNTERYGAGAVNSCDSSGNNPSVNDTASACSGGSAVTCNSMGPWAGSNQVAYGFAAVPAEGDICGRCYQLEFTGVGHYGADPGSQALAGKTMIVEATNIGDIGTPGHFDLLIPGGGVGINYGCGQAWGIPDRNHPDLGAERGGLLADCKSQNSELGAIKSCMRDRCQRLFGDRNLTDMMDSCIWFVDWFEAADNPEFIYQEIDCPQELRNVSGSHR